jgi:chromosome segregation ATPase
LEEENAYLKAIVDKDKTEIKDLEYKLKNLEQKVSELRNIQTHRSNDFNRRQRMDPNAVSEMEKLHQEIEKLRLKNNELSLDLAKFSLLKSNNKDVERKNKYLKDDNSTLRDQLREKEREIKSLKNAFNDILNQNNQYHDKYGSPTSASFGLDQELIGDNQSIKRTNEFVMRLLQQLYSAVGIQFTF